MASISKIFNEFAAVVTGFHGAMAGVKVGMGAAEVLFAAAGTTVATGVIPTVAIAGMLLAGAAVGGAIGYMGAKQLLSLLDDDPPEREPQVRTRTPVPRFGR